MARKCALIVILISLMLSVIFLAGGGVIWSITILLSGIISSGLILYYAADEGSIRKEMTATGGDSDEYSPEYSDQGIDTAITFENIAGLEEIKEEIMEIADFIKNPEKYERFGATLPKGVLFYGPPGTGKTMIAKALANEAKTGFIYSSGSEFVEKYVGVGAGRIRNLFEKARKNKNCIIFIDEIDAIGSSRNSDSNSERDQTLNQLLTEMDGFRKSDGIVVIGATNRIDLLDKALIRPGRFDRHIYIGNPSESAREKILTIHMQGKPVSGDVDIKNIASRTKEMSGAELRNVVNEAAILAIRNSHDSIKSDDFDEAILKSTAGLKNSSVKLTERDLRCVCVHEAGHAIANIVIKKAFPYQISVVSRNMALGMVVTSDGKDGSLMDEKDLENTISVLLAGRAAEEIILGRITTGAQNDIKRANELARHMFSDFGMSSECFNMILDQSSGTRQKNIMEKYVSELLKKCYEESKDVVSKNREFVIKLSEELLIKNTLSEAEIRELYEEAKIMARG